MGRCFVTEQAATRARQQFDVPREGSFQYVAEALARSVRLPWRHARSLVKARDALRHESPAFRVNGTMLLECRGRSVVSVRRLAVEELATILTWAATGAWVADGV